MLAGDGPPRVKKKVMVGKASVDGVEMLTLAFDCPEAIGAARDSASSVRPRANIGPRWLRLDMRPL